MKPIKLLCAAVVAFCVIASAQSASDSMKARLPHAVMVGTVEIPAGECTIVVNGGGSGNTALLIRSESGAQAMVLANPIYGVAFEGGRQSGLILSNHGGTYRLDQVWFSAKGTGYQVIGSTE